MERSDPPSQKMIQEWARKARMGNRFAFEKLFRHFYAPLCDFAFQIVKNRHAAEDIVQHIFVDIWSKEKTWNPKHKVKSYLFKSVRNRSLNYIRDDTSKQLDQPASSHEVHYFIEEEHYAKELEKAIHQAYQKMPEQRRLIFLLSRENGLTYREIAETLNISIKTVETQIGRTLKTLRKELSSFL